MPEELWREVCDIVEEAEFKTIPKEKKGKKAKRLSEEALQIAEKIREVKGKGERERYAHLNAQFQRKARRDEKAFLIEQCKEIEGNNRMRKRALQELEIPRKHFTHRYGHKKGQRSRRA